MWDGPRLVLPRWLLVLCLFLPDERRGVCRAGFSQSASTARSGFGGTPAIWTEKQPWRATVRAALWSVVWRALRARVCTVGTTATRLGSEAACPHLFTWIGPLFASCGARSGGATRLDIGRGLSSIVGGCTPEGVGKARFGGSLICLPNPSTLNRKSLTLRTRSERSEDARAFRRRAP